jgi:hypothetical protein
MAASEISPSTIQRSRKRPSRENLRRFIKVKYRRQIFLLPAGLDDYVAEDNTRLEQAPKLREAITRSAGCARASPAMTLEIAKTLQASGRGVVMG